MGKIGVEEDWQELAAISGHKGPVKGLAWSPNGGYLISAGYALVSFVSRSISQ